MACIMTATLCLDMSQIPDVSFTQILNNPEDIEMNPIESWHHETNGKNACEALRHNGFDAVYVATGAEALAKLMEYVKPGMKVGFGGSMSVKGLGTQAAVAAAGAEVLDHGAPGLGQERKMEILRAQLTCDLFVSGTNALTLDGELLNVDANGNRVGALCFGPRKVVVVAGANKIVRDLDEAFSRLETTAGPLNNKRLDRPNPCTKTGQCMDCDGPMRSCRIYQILKRRPAMSDFTVIVVGEALGY